MTDCFETMAMEPLRWTEDANVPSSNHAGRRVSPIDWILMEMSMSFSNYRLDPNFYLRNNGDGTLVIKHLQRHTGDCDGGRLWTPSVCLGTSTMMGILI